MIGLDWLSGAAQRSLRSQGLILAALGAMHMGSAFADETGAVLGGDPVAGRVIIIEVACGACHVIPGVPGANGIVGPPLSGFGQRTLIAGSLTNSPANLVAWLEDPPALLPSTGMPDIGLGRQNALDVAAYLKSLK